MRYIDNFKFFSHGTKKQTTPTIDRWTSEMNEFAVKISAEYNIPISDARTMWVMYKMAEIETLLGNHIANS